MLASQIFRLRFPTPYSLGSARRFAFRGLATHASGFRIPVIDFGRYQTASSTEQKQETANEVVDGFKEAGFIYIKNHGIPDSVITNVYQKVRLTSS